MKSSLLLFFTLFLSYNINAQQFSAKEITKTVEALKKDRRGPYHRIKWFCDDGSIRGPKDPCPEETGGGIQHASYKEEVIKLGKENHIFLGDILAYTAREDFWDTPNYHSRIKQYQLQKYLFSVDNGWILERGQFYRGAVQYEDETEWGINFYKWILSDDEKIEKNFYLIRQSIRDIPHKGDSNLAQKIRSQSKVISDNNSNFMNARIKIHGKPSRSDIQLVENFSKEYENELSSEEKEQLSELTKSLKKYYQPIDYRLWQRRIKNLATHTFIKEIIESLGNYQSNVDKSSGVSQLSQMLCVIREGITSVKDSNDRLTLLDLSIALENELLIKTQEYQPKTLNELLSKIYTLSHAAMGTGLIEMWEWNSIKDTLKNYTGKNNLSLKELNEFLRIARGVVEWSTATVRANYQAVVEEYSYFEKKSIGFIDDKIRSSVALSLGQSVSKLNTIIAQESSLENTILNLNDVSRVRGLNPGFAMGKLIVVENELTPEELNSNHIYIFQKPPSDMKPVAGIMTVSEGNLVSHVQLLARNLGIPNAALSSENLNDLIEFEGKYVFYAVSNKGNVIVKLKEDMTTVEKELFNDKEKSKTRITVPTDQINLAVKNVVDIRDVDASDSGIICGPKAANLGELKSMFPENVVEGLVVPFGVFREHMNQQMPDRSQSYWEFLISTFKEADRMKSQGRDMKSIENFQLKELKKLREAILEMDLKTSFMNNLTTKFQNTFGSQLGNTPVFLRSDTNMEDLEEFTGAGLNLTLFNIVPKKEILEGIKKVWASPYTERSFTWRQKYLSNPENVYPSILIIPSVDVDYSGVLITKGINVGSEQDVTVAFSRGAGGAVNGQSAETRLVTPKTNILLAPAREANYIRLPKRGKTSSHIASFDRSILNEKNIQSIRKLTDEVRRKMSRKDRDYKGAYDIELGFKNDQLWLFQIRPFVENDRAVSSEYLDSISPKINYNRKINLQKKI